MSDPTAPDRHQRHDACFVEHADRLGALEEQATATRIWRNGNGSPHRGAESRITRIEETAVMRDQMDEIAARVVRAYQSTVRAQIQTFAPYVLMTAGLIYALATGQKVAP